MLVNFVSSFTSYKIFYICLNVSFNLFATSRSTDIFTDIKLVRCFTLLTSELKEVRVAFNHHPYHRKGKYKRLRTFTQGSMQISQPKARYIYMNLAQPEARCI